MPSYDQIVVANDRGQPGRVVNVYYTVNALQTPKYSVFVDVQLLGVGVERTLYRVRFLGRLTLTYNNQTKTAESGYYDQAIKDLFGVNPSSALNEALRRALLDQHVTLVRIGGVYVVR